MSMTWRLNDSGNWSGDIGIVGGVIPTIYGADEVSQRILVTLRHFWYEYWLNLQGGVPWYELILGSKDRPLAEAILRKIILQVPGVVTIINFSVAFRARALSIATTVEVQDESTTSVISLNEVIP